MEELELWMDIEDYEGLYQVSNLGRVKSLAGNATRKEKILKPSPDGKSPRLYYSVGLCKNGKKTTTRVHRLVAKHFVPNINNLSQVNHKDNDQFNNHISNLEWCTNRENNNHKFTFRKTTSKYPGVSWSKEKSKWRAQIQVDGTQKHLGLFRSEIEASQAYQNALKQLIHG